jgi:uncharacterized membrane protein
MNTHLFIVHFPVSLLLLGLLVDLAGVGLGDRALRARAGQLIILGGVLALIAFATGSGAKVSAVSAGRVDLVRMGVHEQWGALGAWALLGAAIARAMVKRRFDGPMGWVNLGIAAAAAALVVAITISGMRVVHGT